MITLTFSPRRPRASKEARDAAHRQQQIAYHLRALAALVESDAATMTPDKIGPLAPVIDPMTDDERIVLVYLLLQSGRAQLQQKLNGGKS